MPHTESYPILSHCPQLVTQRMLERRGSAGALLASLWDWPQETCAKPDPMPAHIEPIPAPHVTARH